MTTTASGHTAPTTVSPTAPAPVRSPGSRLGPDEFFPQNLGGLGLAELQVLHSRITRQLDHDYLTDPTGPHGATLDRSFELAAELDARDAA